MGLTRVGLVRPELTPVEIAPSGLSGAYPYRRILWLKQEASSVRTR